MYTSPIIVILLHYTSQPRTCQDLSKGFYNLFDYFLKTKHSGDNLICCRRYRLIIHLFSSENDSKKNADPR